MSGPDASKQNVLRVLVIDDDAVQRELLRVLCGKVDYPVVEAAFAETGREGLERLGDASIDLVLTDFRLPDIDGLEVLRQVKSRNPAIRVVVMTAFENALEAVELMKEGADDYLVKPTREPDLSHLFLRTHETLTLSREENLIRAEIAETFGAAPLHLIGKGMARVLQTAARCTGSDATVVISGESGTGKELIARLIHATSLRKDGPFVAVNMAALPQSLVESELFGHRKGSYTGATEDRIGRVEEARWGTIFIDEVGEIEATRQVKLLRVVQFGEIQRIGENATRKLDVRIIAATNRNLEDLVKRNVFRADLFYRLNVIPIHIPPLRERKADIPELVGHFIGRNSAKLGKEIRGISREAMDMLMRHAFPGNVRELENLIERAVVLSRTDTLRLADFSDLDAASGAAPACDPATLEGNFEEKMRGFEIQLLEHALEEADGNQSRASRLLGISERHLRSRMEKLGIENKWKGP